jgi:integrase
VGDDIRAIVEEWATYLRDRKLWGGDDPLFPATAVNPHSFRKTLAQLGERVCRTPEELKAWSQNLGHEDVMTTLRSYGEVPCSRQAEIIRDLHLASEPDMEVPSLGW